MGGHVWKQMEELANQRACYICQTNTADHGVHYCQQILCLLTREY